jgi:hypothetical protein
LHSSNSDNNCVFAVTFVSIELSWKPFYQMLLSVSWLKMLPSSIFHRQFFPFLVFGLLSPVTVISVFPMSRYLFSIQTGWLRPLHLSGTISILLSGLYLCSSFTLDCFTLLVYLPKNKIRSIINSFKLLNTELRDF